MKKAILPDMVREMLPDVFQKRESMCLGWSWCSGHTARRARTRRSELRMAEIGPRSHDINDL